MVDQNTVAGTSGGQSVSVITTLGNNVLDAFGALANVASGGINSASGVVNDLSSFKERWKALFAGQQQQVTPPQQTTPPWQVANWNDYFSDPQNVQKIFLYGGIAAALAVGALYVAKKAR